MGSWSPLRPLALRRSPKHSQGNRLEHNLTRVKIHAIIWMPGNRHKNAQLLQASRAITLKSVRSGQQYPTYLINKMTKSLSISQSECRQLAQSGVASLYEVLIPYEDGYISLGETMMEGDPQKDWTLLELFEPEELEETIESLDHDCSGRTASKEEFWSSYSECLKNPDLVMFNPVPHEILDTECISAKIYEEFRNERIAETSKLNKEGSESVYR